MDYYLKFMLFLDKMNDRQILNTILVIGDPHFKVCNITETNLMTKSLIELSNRIKPSFIVNLGDTLHRHETIHVSPLMRAEYMIKELSKISPIYLLIGNHDRPNNSNFMTEEHPFNALKEWDNVIVIDKTNMYNHNNQNFIFVPYVPPGKFDNALKNIDINNNITTIFAHQEFKGAKMGAITSTDGDIWELNKPLVISGHIHDYDKLQDNIIYVGTPMQHAFGDKSDKTVSIFRFYSDGSWDEERVDLGLIKREIIYIEPKNIHNFIPDKNKLVKLVVRGLDSELKAISKFDVIKKLKNEGIKISYKIISDDIDQNNMLDSNYSNHMSYMERLYLEICNDESQLMWFNKIFNLKSPPTSFKSKSFTIRKSSPTKSLQTQHVKSKLTLKLKSNK